MAYSDTGKINVQHLAPVKFERFEFAYRTVQTIERENTRVIEITIVGELKIDGVRACDMVVFRSEEGDGGNDRTYTDYEIKKRAKRFNPDDHEDSLLELAVKVESSSELRKLSLRELYSETSNYQ